MPFSSLEPPPQALKNGLFYWMGLDFNPRFPRGKRPSWAARASFFVLFQSTLPARKATKNTSAKQVELVFQSTLPTGKATLLGLLLQPIPHISIHASREGSDSQMRLSMADASSFQSTLPAGEATYMPELHLAEHIFQSTLPAKEATQLT